MDRRYKKIIIDLFFNFTPEESAEFLRENPPDLQEVEEYFERNPKEKLAVIGDIFEADLPFDKRSPDLDLWLDRELIHIEAGKPILGKLKREFFDVAPRCRKYDIDRLVREPKLCEELSLDHVAHDILKRYKEAKLRHDAIIRETELYKERYHGLESAAREKEERFLALFKP